MQNRKPQLLCFCLRMLFSLSELISVVAFVASTDCHKASLCDIFLANYSHLKYCHCVCEIYSFSVCITLHLSAVILSDTQLSNLVRHFHEDKNNAGVLALYRDCLEVRVLFLTQCHSYCVLESP